MRLALFQPDIPQNVGAAIRLAACLDVELEVIGPCGFPFSDRALKRAAMDYGRFSPPRMHDGWQDFTDDQAARGGRLVLFTTQAALPFTEFCFAADDTLLFGRESAGAPQAVHDRADARLLIPLRLGARSLNVVNAAAMALGEALRQTGGYPATAGA